MRSALILLAVAGGLALALGPVHLDLADRLAARELVLPLEPPEARRRPPLLLVAWRCIRADGTIALEGEVRNVGPRMLANVTAVGVFQAANKDLVKSDRALLEDSTLLPGQSSRFRIGTADEPGIASCALDFGHLMGGSIRFTEAVEGPEHQAPTPREVRALQRRLGALGYDPGRPDGVLGPKTRDAIVAFQQDHGLAADGRISDALLELIPRP